MQRRRRTAHWCCGASINSLRVAPSDADFGVKRLRSLTTRSGTKLARECRTFHAKIVLADGVAAYVGSANFLYRSREANLECGFLLEGDAVAPVTVLVEAVLRTVGCPDATG